MKKKIILGAMAAAVVTAVTLTGCGGSGETVEAPSVVAGTMEMSELDAKGLEGLCDYLEGNGIIAGNYVEMKADVLGAVDGRKYQFKFGDTTIITEFYEFDLNNLNETAKATIDSVKEKGTFSVLGTEVKALATESGKYVYIYGDTKTDEKNVAQMQKAVDLIQEFENEEASIKVTEKKTEKTEKAE